MQQQESRNDAARTHNGSHREDPFLDPVDQPEVMSGKDRLRPPAGHRHDVRHCLVTEPQ